MANPETSKVTVKKNLLSVVKIIPAWNVSFQRNYLLLSFISDKEAYLGLEILKALLLSTGLAWEK